MYDNNPNLEDLLCDPLVRLVMASDGVEETHIRALARRVAGGRTSGEHRAEDRFEETGSPLRHVPSCRRGPSCSQPYA